MKIRNFMFRLSNPTIVEKAFWTSLEDVSVRNRLRVNYCTFQEEICPTTGTPHLQGYCEMTVQRTLQAIKNVFSDGQRLHVDMRNGTALEAIIYVTKTRTRAPGGICFTAGEPKRGGKDNLRNIAAQLNAGSTLTTTLTENPATDIQYHERILAWSMRRQERRCTPPMIFIIYGNTGTGKTAYAAAEWPNAYWVPEPEKGGWWWYNYQGEDTIILDDFNSYIPYRKFLRLNDRYPFTAQAKGTNFDMNATTLVYTSNTNPLNWYPGVLDTTHWKRRMKDFVTTIQFHDDSTYEDMKYTTTIPENQVSENIDQLSDMDIEEDDDNHISHQTQQEEDWNKEQELINMDNQQYEFSDSDCGMILSMDEIVY